MVHAFERLISKISLLEKHWIIDRYKHYGIAHGTYRGTKDIKTWINGMHNSDLLV